MCDTILASPASTAEQVMLFGKNSDRQRNEAQCIELIAGAEHAPGTHLACTYLTIPQAPKTHAVLICRPFWMWGAEMGANEHRLVVGNEGLQARSPPPRESALTGMDLVRLTLERATTAAEAIEVITDLLERYGQGGNGGHITPAYYHNGFMIADAREAFVLETLDREWLVERVGRVRSMSNRYSIGRDVDHVSRGLHARLRNLGWAEEGRNLDYAEAVADPHREHIGNAGARRKRSTALLGVREGELCVRDMMHILRDHGSDGAFDPSAGAHYTLCMHAGAEDRPGQTVNSMVSEIAPSGAVHWVTGTAAPCTSIFKPVLMDAPLPPQTSPATDRFDPTTLWWRHERLHRAAVLSGDFISFIEDIRAERDAAEIEFRERVSQVLDGGTATDRAQVVAGCWDKAFALENEWSARLRPAHSRKGSLFVSGWNQMNRLAGLDLAAEGLIA